MKWWQYADTKFGRIEAGVTRIRIIKMDDPYHPVPAGTTGIVERIDGAGQLWCKWDGVQSGLAVIPEVDEFEIIS